MEDFVQTATQTSAIDSCNNTCEAYVSKTTITTTVSNNNKNNNNNNNNNNNITVISNCEKINGVKPPLLPKPKILKLDSGNHKSVKSVVSSPKISTDNQVYAFQSEKLGSAQISVSPQCKIVNQKLQKPPAILPKPQVPPKSNFMNSSKSNNKISDLVSSKNLEQSKGMTVDKTLFTPVKLLQINENNDFDSLCTIQKGLASSSILPSSLVLGHKITSTLTDNEDNQINNSLLIEDHELSDLCKEVQKCSKHSHLLKISDAPSQILVETVSHSNTLNYSNFMKEKIVCTNSSPTKNFTNLPNNEILSHFSGYKVEVNSSLNLRESISVNKFEVPNSFLHRHATSPNQTKELLERNKKPEEAPLSESFLHKNRDKCSLKLGKSKSFGLHDSIRKEISKSASADCNDVNLLKENQKSEYLDSDVSSISKRFLWFGSFGKGNKKGSSKKSRCVSQFYSSSNEMDDQVLLEKNRTKSLPNIKHNRPFSGSSLSLDKNLKNLSEVSHEYPHSDSDDDNHSLNQGETHLEKDGNTRAYLKARELMTSEEVFVDVLKLLNVDFRNFVELRNFESKNSCIPIAEISKILNHLSQLQALNEDLLDDLRKRINNWDSNPKISDVIVKKGAFLKMYTVYIQNFESQTNYLDECIIKYPKFAKIVKEFEASGRCKKLTLKHYMLKPVQRIPQYRLLLNDYLKNLEESSVDYVDTQNALKIICEVVDHANRNLGHGDKEGRLMHFQAILSDYELIKPGRELIKDGALDKICRKSVKDRYFILLNDCLLHTTYSKQYLKIHQELPLSGMKISFNDDQNCPNSFRVHSIKRSFILCAKNAEECREWVNTLQNTIDEFIKRQKTFMNVNIELDSSFKLGKEAPVWVPDSKVTMCQICTAEFTALFRRHHCRGCGKVICKDCGNNQAPLQYNNFKPDRVCDQCFDLLLKDYEESEDNICSILRETIKINDRNLQNEYLSIKAKFIKYNTTNSWKKTKYVPPRLKEVSANDAESLINGCLYRKSRKSWKQFWYVLKDHVLYVYKASEDVVALDTIPVLGYRVERASVNIEDFDKNLIFSLVHPPQNPIIFRAESQSSADRWFKALTAASNFDYLAV